MINNSNFLNDNASAEDPQTVFDLEPDELDFLIKFRQLSSEKQKELLKHLGIE